MKADDELKAIPKLPLPEPHKEIQGLWDKDNPLSFYNLLPDNFLSKLETCPPEYALMPEVQLQDILYPKQRWSSGHDCFPLDNRVRLAFWAEYERAVRTKEKMYIAAIYTGACSQSYFQHHFLENPEKIAWMLCRPAAYDKKLNETIYSGIDRLREYIARGEVLKRDGTHDPAFVQNVLKIVQFCDARLHGGIVQKIEQKTESKTLNINVDAKSKKPEEMSMEEIEARLKELRIKAETMKNALPEAREVIVID